MSVELVDSESDAATLPLPLRKESTKGVSPVKVSHSEAAKLRLKRGSTQAVADLNYMNQKHELAEERQKIAELEKNHSTIKASTTIENSRLNEIVDDVNYMSKQLLFDMKIPITKKKEIENDPMKTFYQALVAVSEPKMTGEQDHKSPEYD